MNKADLLLHKNKPQASKSVNTLAAKKVLQDEIDIQKAEYYARIEKGEQPGKKKRPPQKDSAKIVEMVRQCLQSSREAYLYIKNGKYSCKGKQRAYSKGWTHLHMFTSVEEAKGFEI